MTIRRSSLILPCHGWDDFPTHLTGSTAAELLTAATALWHPALIHATQGLPGWHPADEPPDPASLEGELVVVPPVSRERMAPDWCDRLRATSPRNPPPVEAVASREDTITALLAAASIDPNQVASASVADFLALGYAHLLVELITRALRYTSVLDFEQFACAVVAAASAAVAGIQELMREELGRAFDLLSDARNHVYSVDFYVIDVTLLATTTLGEPLREKLAAGSPTNLLITGEQIERMAEEQPETLAELKRALEAGTASIVGGFYRGGTIGSQSPESVLAELVAGRQAASRILGREYGVFGQFEAEFSPLLPGLLKNLGFGGALHAAFDGGGLPRADQRKTNWGEGEGASIEALSAIPLDVSRPETWLKLAERIGDSIAHDHVATILLAGWPGTGCEYLGDLRQAARYGSVLGKLVTLDEYFRETREPDHWTNFNPREYPNRGGTDFDANPISSRVDAYRQSVRNVQRQLGAGFTAIAGVSPASSADTGAANLAVINPWNFAFPQMVGVDAFNLATSAGQQFSEGPVYLPDVPGCGYATLASAAPLQPMKLAEGVTLRNERFELTVSRKTGGIQSLRMHRDRNTRVSQRLVFHHETGKEPAETRMVADEVKITRNDPLVGEIAARGRLLGAAGEVLTRFAQRVRAVRGFPAVLVDVELEPEMLPDGNIWKSYLASRLAWSQEALSIRCGSRWSGRETTRERIEACEWIEVDDAIGRVTCFALGLPFHRVAGPQWLDSLLLVAGEERRRFQFAIGLDRDYPTHVALGLLAGVDPYLCASPNPLSSPNGWFLHVGARNVVCTFIDSPPDVAGAIRLRLLETEGRETRTTLAAFRPFRAAWTTDFRGNRADVLSVAEGRVPIDMGPYGWIQIEAEW